MPKQSCIGKKATKVRKEDGYTIVRYWNTDVVKFNDELITLDSGGWRTVTTKNRMNQTAHEYGLGFYVYQNDYDWYVKLPNENPVMFKDGFTILR